MAHAHLSCAYHTIIKRDIVRKYMQAGRLLQAFASDLPAYKTRSTGFPAKSEIPYKYVNTRAGDNHRVSQHV